MLANSTIQSYSEDTMSDAIGRTFIWSSNRRKQTLSKLNVSVFIIDKPMGIRSMTFIATKEAFNLLCVSNGYLIMQYLSSIVKHNIKLDVDWEKVRKNPMTSHISLDLHEWPSSGNCPPNITSFTSSIAIYHPVSKSDIHVDST